MKAVMSLLLLGLTSMVLTDTRLWAQRPVDIPQGTPNLLRICRDLRKNHVNSKLQAILSVDDSLLQTTLVECFRFITITEYKRLHLPGRPYRDAVQIRYWPPGPIGNESSYVAYLKLISNRLNEQATNPTCIEQFFANNPLPNHSGTYPFSPITPSLFEALSRPFDVLGVFTDGYQFFVKVKPAFVPRQTGGRNVIAIRFLDFLDLPRSCVAVWPTDYFLTIGYEAKPLLVVQTNNSRPQDELIEHT